MPADGVVPLCPKASACTVMTNAGRVYLFTGPAREVLLQSAICSQPLQMIDIIISHTPACTS